MNQKFFAFAAILILIAGNVFAGFLYFQAKNELKQVQSLLAMGNEENKTLIFLDLLVGKVLNNAGEVSFDDRLLLENSVREIGNTAILDEWSRFSNSQTEDEAQAAMKNLLSLLVKNIKN